MNDLNNNKIPKTVDPEVAKKDLNGDGHITQKELEMDLEFKRKELEDAAVSYTHLTLPTKVYV